MFLVVLILPSKPGQSHELSVAHELISIEATIVKTRNVIFFIKINLISSLKIGYLLIVSGKLTLIFIQNSYYGLNCFFW